MLNTLRLIAFFLGGLFTLDAFAQEPIRIDRPREGELVELEIEVAGVATPGATVEVWVDRVFIVDTVAEPDGWYVARLSRPPNTTEASRIFVHELDSAGQRTSSAVVRVTWSEQPVAQPPIAPPPDIPVAQPEGASPPDAEVAEAPAQPPGTLAPSRGGRVAVEYLVSVAGGITGAILGLLLGSGIGQPDSGERGAASILLGSLGGAMGAAGAVYGVGTAMNGNGSFLWTAAGGLAGALLLVSVGYATDTAGAIFVPTAIIAFALPVLAYELTSDVSTKVQPVVGVGSGGSPTFGVGLRW